MLVCVPRSFLCGEEEGDEEVSLRAYVQVCRDVCLLFLQDFILVGESQRACDEALQKGGDLQKEEGGASCHRASSNPWAGDLNP